MSAELPGGADPRSAFAQPRFDVVRTIGSGGMGSVFEAIDREHGARVALKRLDAYEPQQLLRFKREFREFQNLSHRNLVALRELFSDGAEWFFSMELLDGVDFLEYVRPSVETSTESAPESGDVTVTIVTRPFPRVTRARARRQYGPLDEARLRRALPQLAAGVQALHDAGKLHCDVKPSNVVVTHDGRAVLLDYGVAVDREHLPRTHWPIGTAPYMAPEQMACAPIGCAADWYAVGVVLYEALTGQRPHDRALRALRVENAPRGIASACIETAAAPPDLAALCEELLARDPAERPSGAEVLARLGTRSLPARHRRAQPRHDEPRAPGEPSRLVLRGCCDERESVPFNAFDRVFDAIAVHLESLPQADAEHLLPDDVAVIAHAFPVLWASTAVRAVASREPAGPRESREALFVAIRELFRRLGDVTRLVIAIENFEHADESSRALVLFLVASADAPTLWLDPGSHAVRDVC